MALHLTALHLTALQLTALQLTRDHKPDDKYERERIQRAGGRVEPTYVPGLGFQGPPRVWKSGRSNQQVGGTPALTPQPQPASEDAPRYFASLGSVAFEGGGAPERLG